MRLKALAAMIPLLGVITFTSCEDDDVDLKSAPINVQEAFDVKYPEVPYERWEKRQDYFVAEFRNNGVETEEWFTAQAEWCMTETDIDWNRELLPEAVKTALASSKYGTWRIDDINFYERKTDSFYQIGVETQGEKDRNLYYAPDGTLIKDEKDRENDDVYPHTAL